MRTFRPFISGASPAISQVRQSVLGGFRPFVASASRTRREGGSRHSGGVVAARCSALPQGRSEPGTDTLSGFRTPLRIREL